MLGKRSDNAEDGVATGVTVQEVLEVAQKAPTGSAAALWRRRLKSVQMPVDKPHLRDSRATTLGARLGALSVRQIRLHKRAGSSLVAAAEEAIPARVDRDADQYPGAVKGLRMRSHPENPFISTFFGRNVSSTGKAPPTKRTKSLSSIGGPGFYRVRIASSANPPSSASAPSSASPSSSSSPPSSSDAFWVRARLVEGSEVKYQHRDHRNDEGYRKGRRTAKSLLEMGTLHAGDRAGLLANARRGSIVTTVGVKDDPRTNVAPSTKTGGVAAAIAVVPDRGSDTGVQCAFTGDLNQIMLSEAPKDSSHELRAWAVAHGTWGGAVGSSLLPIGAVEDEPGLTYADVAVNHRVPIGNVDCAEVYKRGLIMTPVLKLYLRLIGALEIPKNMKRGNSSLRVPDVSIPGCSYDDLADALTYVHATMLINGRMEQGALVQADPSFLKSAVGDLITAWDEAAAATCPPPPLPSEDEQLLRSGKRRKLSDVRSRPRFVLDAIMGP